MFDFKNWKNEEKILNPFDITKGSMVEFTAGGLAGTGFYRFEKIIEVKISEKAFARYLIYSESEDTEYMFEALPQRDGQIEAYIYKLSDTVPFSEEFLEIAGQKYLTTPDGVEYQRCVMPSNDDRVDGIKGSIRVYDLGLQKIQHEDQVYLWDYKREMDGNIEYLAVEMSEEIGLFKIFIGEQLEGIFYKIYHAKE